MLNLEEFNFNPLRDFNQLHTKKPNVFICYEEEVTIELGKATTVSGKYAKLSLEAATQALLDKKIDVLVTAPINKHTMQEAGFNYPGHTEYLGELLLGTPFIGTRGPVMMLAVEGLRVVPVTIHCALNEVAKRLTTEAIVNATKTTAEALERNILQPHPVCADLAIR